MKAFRLTEWQHDATLENVPQPDPRPGQVLVRIGGAGACHSDLHLMHDFAPGLLSWGPPFTLGHENAGWVEALGAGVSGLEVGPTLNGAIPPSRGTQRQGEGHQATRMTAAPVTRSWARSCKASSACARS